MSECKLPENEQERKQQFIDSTIEGINGSLEMLHEQMRFLKHLGVEIELEIPNSVAIAPPINPENIKISWFNPEID